MATTTFPIKLWDRFPSVRVLPGAQARMEKAYGAGLDVGAVRYNDATNRWEIIVPGPHDDGQPIWVAFNPNDRSHALTASVFSAVGPGWSAGDGIANIQNHHDWIEHFRKVNKREPSDLEATEVKYKRGTYEALLAAAGVSSGGGTADKPTTSVSVDLTPVLTATDKILSAISTTAFAIADLADEQTSRAKLAQLRAVSLQAEKDAKLVTAGGRPVQKLKEIIARLTDAAK